MTKPLGGHRPLGMPATNFAFSEGGDEEEEQQDSNSIFDQTWKK